MFKKKTAVLITDEGKMEKHYDVIGVVTIIGSTVASILLVVYGILAYVFM